MRCLGPAEVAVDVEAREVDQRGAEDEELRSPYVDEDVLDVGALAHDALALALPQQLLCRADCAGLCPVCGESLNDAEPGAHDHPAEPDPRSQSSANCSVRRLSRYHSAPQWPFRRKGSPRRDATSVAPRTRPRSRG